ncbi:MAG: hypothetical protein KC502_13565 [Myxococcales bacterium]|nr:hypothetical protein [Myxococcales bacterium]
MQIPTPTRPIAATALALLCSLAVACTGPSSAGDADAGGFQDIVIGPCDANALIYKISITDEAVDLAEGATLPVTRGFQGFLFVRIGLKTPLVLPQTIKLKAHVEVPGEVDQVAVYSTVKTQTGPGGYQTTDVPVFFNDTPLAELVGKEATVELWTQSVGCRLRGKAKVTLGSGNYMDEDADFWDQDVSP